MIADIDRLHNTVKHYQNEFRRKVAHHKEVVRRLNKITNEYNSVNEGDTFINDDEVSSEINSSLLTSIYSKMEKDLYTFCDVVARSLEVRILCSDLKGYAFSRVLTYLKGLSALPSNAKIETGNLEKWRKVRNSIVHEYSSLQKLSKFKDDERKWKEINNILNELGIDTDMDSVELVITEINCLNMIDEIDKFFNDITNAIIDNLDEINDL